MSSLSSRERKSNWWRHHRVPPGPKGLGISWAPSPAGNPASVREQGLSKPHVSSANLALQWQGGFRPGQWSHTRFQKHAKDHLVAGWRWPSRGHHSAGFPDRSQRLPGAHAQRPQKYGSDIAANSQRHQHETVKISVGGRLFVVDSPYGEPRHKEFPGRPSPGYLQEHQFNKGISRLETFRGQADDLDEPWQALITGRKTASVSWRVGRIGEDLQQKPSSSGRKRTLGWLASRGSDGCVWRNFFPILLFPVMILTPLWLLVGNWRDCDGRDNPLGI